MLDQVKDLFRRIWKSAKSTMSFWSKFKVAKTSESQDKLASMDISVVEDLIERKFGDFILLATAHYNQQLDYLHISGYPCQEKYLEMLGLAQNYLLRNRSRLFEWWCLHGNGQGKFLDETDLVKIDLGWSFDDILKLKLDELGVIAYIDENHYNGGVPAIMEDGMVNKPFMSRVLEKMKFIQFTKNV